VGETVGWDADIDALLERTFLASTPADCERCLPDIARALASATQPLERARLLTCRARVRSLQLHFSEACDDCAAAVALFESAGGDSELAVDAASLGAAHAARLNNVALASELATKSILGLDSVTDDRLRMEITNRLGVFCYYYLDYDGAVEQFEVSLAAAERVGDGERICRELYNVVDALLRAARERRMSNLGTDTERLGRAEAMARRLVVEERAMTDPRLGTHRLLAEVLCDLGRPEDALEVLEAFHRGTATGTAHADRAELAWVEARCLRLAGRTEEALATARRDVRIVEASGDEHDLMLALEELAACEEATGDLQGALEDTRKVRRHMWAIHRGQTRQLVQQVWEYVDVERDRKKLQTQASEATRSAEEDPLTGLGNRRQLERFLLEESERQTEVACIIADIDFFKDVNDMFGHDVGDAVLRQVGEIFSSKLRAGQKAIRYGGDEFVVVMSGVDPAGASGFAERIRLTVSDFAWTAIAPALHLTISLGVACGPARDWQATIKSADARLLAAKRAGRNTVVTASVGLLSA